MTLEINPHDAARMPRSTPVAQGVDARGLCAFLEAVENASVELHSLMLVRHGNVVAEGWWSPYNAESKHVLFSLSKSFTATAAGLAAAEGSLALDDLVLSHFPEETPAEVSPHLATMRIRDLLTMTTGHGKDTTGSLRADPDGNWIRAFLQQPVEYAPGTHFLYNSGATFMVSALVQKVTGQRVLDYLAPRLFEPLGIRGATWEQSPQGIDTGGWGLSITTEDIARFGQLYLQEGTWNGKRLLPEGWVAEATAAQVSNGDNPGSDWAQGYGYQFWRCRHGVYRGDGAFGQFCVVFPEHDAVLAMTAGVAGMGAVLDLVWTHLLPAFAADPRDDGSSATSALESRLKALMLATPQGAPTSPLATSLSGRTYRFAANDSDWESLRFDFSDPHIPRLTQSIGGATYTLDCRTDGAWLRGQGTLVGGGPYPVALSGAWSAEDTFVVRVCLYETPFSQTLTCHFTGDDLHVQRVYNVQFGATERPALVGRAG